MNVICGPGVTLVDDGWNNVSVEVKYGVISMDDLATTDWLLHEVSWESISYRGYPGIIHKPCLDYYRVKVSAIRVTSKDDHNSARMKLHMTVASLDEVRAKIDSVVKRMIYGEFGKEFPCSAPIPEPLSMTDYILAARDGI